MKYYSSVREETEAMFKTCSGCVEYVELKKQNENREKEIIQNNQKINDLSNQIIKETKDYLRYPIILFTEFIVSSIVGCLAMYYFLWDIINHSGIAHSGIGALIFLLLIVLLYGISYSIASNFDIYQFLSKRNKTRKQDSFVLSLYIAAFLVITIFSTTHYIYKNGGLLSAIFFGLCVCAFTLFLIMILFCIVHYCFNKIFIILFFPVLKPFAERSNTKFETEISQINNYNTSLSTELHSFKIRNTELKEWLDQNTPIPENYWGYAYELCAFINLRRANTLTESINLLEETFHRIRLENQMNNINSAVNNVNISLTKLDNDLNKAVEELKISIRNNRPIQNTTVVRNTYEYHY